VILHICCSQQYPISVAWFQTVSSRLKHRGTVQAYFLMKPSDFGQGFRPNGSDRERKLYGRKMPLDPRSALVQQKNCDLIYEVLNIHTTFDTKNAPRTALLGLGATSPIRPPRASKRRR
jgi:hypothetical protein